MNKENLYLTQNDNGQIYIQLCEREDLHKRCGEWESSKIKICLGECLDSSFNSYNLKKEPLEVIIVPRKNIKMENNKTMFSGLMKNFMPEVDNKLRISMNGDICVYVNNEYIAISQNNELTAYPEDFCFDVPVYVMAKPFNNIQIGDIIKVDKSYAKVIGKNNDNSLKCLSYTGYTNNKKEVKNFIFGKGFVPCVVNMFSAFMGNNNGTGDNTTNIFSNPMMCMMMLNKDNGESKDSMHKMMEMLMCQQMMGGNNMFSNPQMATIKEGQIE